MAAFLTLCYFYQIES